MEQKKRYMKNNVDAYLRLEIPAAKPYPWFCRDELH